MYFSRTIPRLVSYVFYEDDPEHYTSGGAQVFVFGDKGFMFGVFGKGFFKAFPTTMIKFMSDNGLNSLEGYMSPSNARSARMVCRTIPEVSVHLSEPTYVDGHKVIWVTVNKISKGDESSVTSFM